MVVSQKSHRISVTITDAQNDLLEKLGNFQGRSKGSYLRELLDGSEFVLQSVWPLLQLHAATLKDKPLSLREVFSMVITSSWMVDPHRRRLIAALADDPDEADWQRINEELQEEFGPPDGWLPSDDAGAPSESEGAPRRPRKVAS